MSLTATIKEFVSFILKGVDLIPYRANLCRAKVTKFLKSDENFARQSFAQQDNHN